MFLKNFYSILPGFIISPFFRYISDSEISSWYYYFGRYCDGPAYLTSSRVIQKEWKYLIRHKIHFVKLEDFFLTGKLAAEANIGYIRGNSEYMAVHNATLDLRNDGNKTFYLCRDTFQSMVWKHVCETRLKEYLIC